MKLLSVRGLTLSAAVLIALSAAWNQRHVFQDWLRPAGPPHRAIQFDNGTVRQYGAPPDSTATSPQFMPGALRKCYRGPQVSYTDLQCPPGFKEKAVAGPPVTVVASQAQAKPTVGATADAAKTRSTLRDALDVSQNDNIRQQMMERVVNGQR